MCVCVYIYVYYTCIYIYIYMCVCVCMYVCMYMQICKYARRTFSSSLVATKCGCVSPKTLRAHPGVCLKTRTHTHCVGLCHRQVRRALSHTHDTHATHTQTHTHTHTHAHTYTHIHTHTHTHTRLHTHRARLMTLRTNPSKSRRSAGRKSQKSALH